MRWEWRGIAGLLACLVLAGLVGVLTPEQLPADRPVGPDAAGVARTAPLDVELVDAVGASEVRVRNEGYPTTAAFVVIRFTAQAKRDTTLLTHALRTADGLTYRPLARGYVQSSVSALVGQRVTAMVVFEVPPEAVRGAVFTVRPHVTNGVVPVVQTATFRLPDPLPQAPEPPEIDQPSMEAAR